MLTKTELDNATLETISDEHGAAGLPTEDWRSWDLDEARQILRDHIEGFSSDGEIRKHYDSKNETAQYRMNGGDIMEVEWTGSVWVASCGAQYAHASDAMRQEVLEYLRACGEEIDEVDLNEHGEWL